MKKDYWDVPGTRWWKTGMNIAAWMEIPDDFKAAEKKSNESVALLQNEYQVPRYRAGL